MKTFLLFFLLFSLSAAGQSTTPAVKANFGIDGELRANLFNGFVQPANDDWFIQGLESNTTKFVIDTTGAAAIVARYQIDPPFRRQPLFKGMRYSPYSLVGPAGFQRAWIDAVWIRDYSGAPPGDETAFLGSDKNGASPAVWKGSTVTDWGNVGDKVDIADMMVHIRREGATANTNLWFFGGLSLQSTSGDRYFDFELYQTNIFFDRTTGTFLNYGPDAGHTTWQFDASGNILASGDVIFNCHFGTNGLDLTDGFQARIWIDRASLAITPVNFDWAGEFDGAAISSQYGYASIKPKGSNIYYTGIQSAASSWPGPFGHIDKDNMYQTSYAKGQFLEMGVNLTYLGLDPMTILGSDPCGLPFRRILVKTRQSGAFTSNLSDFVGPFDFFNRRPVEALADVPFYCGAIGVSELSIVNPQSASVYTWSTTDGHIATDSINSTITVDSPGTYIVTMQVLEGCPPSGRDTVRILYDASCIPMPVKITGLGGNIKNKISHLSWTSRANKETEYFEIQRSIDGINFETVGKVFTIPPNAEQAYTFDDNVSTLGSTSVYYRLNVKMTAGNTSLSGILKLGLNQNIKGVDIFPNPVKDNLQLSVPSEIGQEARVSVFDISGALLKSNKFDLRSGVNMLEIDASAWKPGTYMVQVVTGTGNVWKKFMVASSVINK